MLQPERADFNTQEEYVQGDSGAAEGQGSGPSVGEAWQSSGETLVTTDTAARLERAVCAFVRTEAQLARHAATLRVVSSYLIAADVPGLGGLDDLVAAQGGLPSSRTARLLAAEFAVTRDVLRRVRSGDTLHGTDVIDVCARLAARSGPVRAPVPSPPRAVVASLLSLGNRDDLPVLMQAVLIERAARAWLPPDVSAAAGRLMFQVVLRLRGVSTAGAVPPPRVAPAPESWPGSGPGPRSPEHDAEGYWGLVASHTLVSVERLAVAARAVVALPARWRERVMPRSGSATSRLLDLLIRQPLVDAEGAAAVLGVSAPAVYAAIDRLETAGVLVELSGYRRNRSWVAHDVIAAADAVPGQVVV